MVDEKQCAKCRAVLPATEFWRDVTKSTGLASWCKTCKLEPRREWMEEYRDAYPEHDLLLRRRHEKTRKRKRAKASKNATR